MMKLRERQPICLRVMEESIAIPKYCIWRFGCHRCAFNQWLDLTEAAALKIPAVIECPEPAGS